MHQNGVRRLGLLGSMLPHHQDMRLADQRDGKQTASLNVLGSFVVLSPNFFKVKTLFTGHRSTSTKAIGTHTQSTMPNGEAFCDRNEWEKTKVTCARNQIRYI
jgi:hypothetical protein